MGTYSRWQETTKPLQSIYAQNLPCKNSGLKEILFVLLACCDCTVSSSSSPLSLSLYIFNYAFIDLKDK